MGERSGNGAWKGLGPAGAWQPVPEKTGAAAREKGRANNERLLALRENVWKALRACLELQMEIALLQDVDKGGKETREMARLCGELAKAALRLNDDTRMYAQRLEDERYDGGIRE